MKIANSLRFGVREEKRKSFEVFTVMIIYQTAGPIVLLKL